MMAAPPMFRREWIVQIKEMLNDDGNNPLRNTAPILRVPTPLLKTKPEAYVPQFMSFGPYHHSKLDKDIHSLCTEPKISMAEAYKVKSVATLMQKMRHCGESFESIVEMIERMRPEIESFYRWPSSTEGGYSQNFALMMATDSSFLLQFLIFGFFESGSKSMDGETINFCKIYFACILFDIRKLENQIPLSLLKVVFDNGKNALLDDTTSQFDQLLLKICKGSSPFPLRPMLDNEREHHLMQDMERENHLMGCIHKYLSLVLEMQPRGGEDQRRMGTPLRMFNGILKETLKRIHRFLSTISLSSRRWRRLQGTLLEKSNDIVKKILKWIHYFIPTIPQIEYVFPNGMSAGQLTRAGIKFRPFSKVPDCIRLDKDTATVYLPPISVNDIGTEVFLKNMLALEFNDAFRPNYVTGYVALMGTLIQSPDDVRLLVDRHVISRGFFSLTDECIVKVWSDVRQPFLRGSVSPLHLELVSTLRQWLKKNYWKNKMKNKASGLFDYLSSWKFLAPMAAILGLIMTGIQTYCSLYQIYGHNSKR